MERDLVAAGAVNRLVALDYLDDLLATARDAAHVEQFPEDSLFTFAISTPRSEDELDPDLLQAWTMQEELREAAAVDTGGRYYLPTAIEIERETNEAPVEETTDSSPSLADATPYDVACRGPRFVAAALVRSIAIRFPATLPPLRTLRRLLVGRPSTPIG